MKLISSAHGMLLAGAFLSGMLGGCGKAHTESSEKASQDEQAVRYVKVAMKRFPETLELAAKIQADPTKLVRIFPPASGRVAAINVRPGDRVTQGETLALLNSSDVASARSDFAKASIEAERATRASERERMLLEHGAAAEKDYQDTRAQADAAQAELLRARQHLQLLHVSASSASDEVAIKSPISGVVLALAAAAGEYSKSLDAADPLVTVADLSSLWAVGDVYERDIARLRAGTKALVTIEAFPGRKWRGVLGPISGALDPVTRTLKVRVTIANPDLLLHPEMFGAISVDTGMRESLMVPAAAVVREGNYATVFVKNAGKPEQRQVKLGQTVDGMVEVLDGLHEGDEIAVDGAELLKGAPPA